MSSGLLTKYDFESHKSIPLPGTEDWVEVAKLGSQGGYEWTDFNVFYSPSARRYFWHGGSGCSCNSWSDDLGTSADFENGDRAALLRGWETFTKEHKSAIHVPEYLSGVEEIRNFKEPK